MSQRFKRKRKRRYFNCPVDNESESVRVDPHSNNDEPQSHKPRPPRGLKGKALGLWYRDRNRLTARTKPLGCILLSDAKKQKIIKLMNETASWYSTVNVVQLNTYEHLEETHFKHEFLQHITGNVIQKLQSYNKINQNFKNEMLDDLYLKELKNKQLDPKYKKMQEDRNRLPAVAMKEEILNLIRNHQLIIVSGETGCGKTTQVSQFVLDDFIQKCRGSQCKIICTQPRRISAVSVAERVAQERAERLGVSVGYQIRLEKSLPRDRGSILFCTTGVLLKFMESDPALSDISHVMIDEIHERDVTSDFLLTIVKDIIKYRKDIKIVLMSATLNAEAFSKYYDNAPHINIPGFTYPVTQYFLEDVIQKTRFKFEVEVSKRRQNAFHSNNIDKTRTDYIEPYIRKLESEKTYDSFVISQLKNPKSENLNMDLVFVLLRCICSEQVNENGAILIFLPGFKQISTLSKIIKTSPIFPSSKYIVIPLHSQLPTIDQKQIFYPAPEGKRKIIISTNIAETSITIDDVTTVIDCGYIKMSNYDLERNVETLNTEFVSWANAAQRKGRAGRVKSGVCYHLLSKARFELLDKFQTPEVLRKRLEDVILQLKLLQFGDAGVFLGRLMDPPDPVAVKASITLLQRLGALDEEESLTPLGFHMAKLPVGAQCAKMLIMAALFSCLDPVLSVAASLGFKDGFQLNAEDPKLADKARVELSQNTYSDHLLMHFALKGFEDAYNQWEFCRKYFLSLPTMRLLKEMRNEFAKLLFDMKFIESANPRSHSNNYNSDNLSLVKAVIGSGLYPNVAIVHKKKRFTFLSSVNQPRMQFHGVSVLSSVQNIPSPLVVYHKVLKSSSVYVYDATCLFPLPVVFFGDKFQKIHESSFTGISINGSMRFLCTENTSAIVEQLRERLNVILNHKISHPGFVDWKITTPEVTVLKAIIEMITTEDMDDFDLSDYDDN